ncbi:MAG: hypothetical protein CL878_04080 [Dehalococcoidia bacterium]|nr:hypothetical protein [Dehalococcoidia bacterium]
MQDHLSYIKDILGTHLGATLLSSRRVSQGHSGFVYVTDVALDGVDGSLVVKLNRMHGTASIETESVDARVYAGHSAGLEAVHRLLTLHRIPTYRLLAHGRPTSDLPYVWHVMTCLPGLSVRAHMAYAKGVDLEPLHKVAGEALGKLHTISRPYDGKIDQTQPYALSWQRAFFQSVRHKLNNVVNLDLPWFGHLANRIAQIIDDTERIWRPPSAFVLSDMNGLQGMAQYADGDWTFTGHIDLEDYRFRDPRMVLAGCEVSLEFEGRQAPPAFWQGYRRFKEVESDYDKIRDVLKLYFLLEWLPYVYEADWRGNPSDREAVVQKFRTAISKLLG